MSKSYPRPATLGNAKYRICYPNDEKEDSEVCIEVVYILEAVRICNALVILGFEVNLYKLDENSDGRLIAQWEAME